jgi:hypothetical protein
MRLRLRWRLRVFLGDLRSASVASSACDLACSLERFQGTGNRRPPARTRDPPATNPPPAEDVDRPALSCSGQPDRAARPLAVLHHHSGDAAGLASPLRGEALDICASTWAPADPTGDLRTGPAPRPRQPAVGLSAHCRRTEGSWLDGLGNDRAHMASGSRPRTRPARAAG